ncbi:MAG: SIS domain-containing protein [Chlamydiia bacterium]|nr:SIS domain-containing protein [Chlamydiia bacterium]
MKEKIESSVNQVIDAAKQLKEPDAIEFIDRAAEEIASAFSLGKKLLIAGNGGSLCDAMHFAEELTGLFRIKRAPLPAIAFSDPGHLTCVSNDLGYSHVFSRLIEAYGQKGDCFVGLTTSGNSENLIHAFQAAEQKELFTIAFLGKGGGRLKGMADLEWSVNNFSTSDRIQEAHMAAIHIIIEMIEEHLFYGPMQESFHCESFAVAGR